MKRRTDVTIDNIRELYNKGYTLKKVCKTLQCGYGVVYHRIKNTDISFTKESKHLVNKENIIKYKNQGLKQSEIADRLKCSTRYIIQKSKEYDVKFERKPLYPINLDFLNTWSHELAYVLGFIMSDGCLNKKCGRNRHRLRIEINMKDLSLLKSIRDLISPTRPVRENLIHRNKSGTISKACDFTIPIDQDLYKYFVNLGIVERKTGLEQISDNIPKEFVWSYILGLFDGDGCIYKRKISGYDWSICTASKTLIDQLHKLIPNGKIKLCITNGNILYNIDVRDRQGIIDIRNKLYQDSKIWLDRKRDLMFQVTI